jgi:predicted GNAT superfamily acetyltransferase
VKVEVRAVSEARDLREVMALFDEVWGGSVAGHTSFEQLRSLAHGGNYVSAAYDLDGSMIGAAAGFFSEPLGVAMHSHVTGVVSSALGRHVGFAIKLHQRAWALERGLREITWLFDPLVQRTAHFNFNTLRARGSEYIVDFYGTDWGTDPDPLGSDRLLLTWWLDSPDVVRACDPDLTPSRPSKPSFADLPFLLQDAASGPVVNEIDHRRVRVAVPRDIARLRSTDPGLARRWRLAVRDTLGEALTSGGRVLGFVPDGWYVVERSGESLDPA